MASSLPIGDFSRATHMSIKTLRHYHRVGLLEPADVDQFTGHRRYTTDQIPTAQVIRRFRELDMPIEEIRGILAAPDVAARNELIAAHLSRLEEGLARTQNAVASLRDLLGPPQTRRAPASATAASPRPAPPPSPPSSTWRTPAPGTRVRSASSTPPSARRPCRPAGAPGGIYATDLFTRERGQATVFIPCTGPVRPVGRVEAVVVPPAELAIIVHQGPHDDIDRAYGALATHVTQHALAVDGPIREYYLSGRHDTADESAWRTEIGWPIFQTRPGG